MLDLLSLKYKSSPKTNGSIRFFNWKIFRNSSNQKMREEKYNHHLVALIAIKGYLKFSKKKTSAVGQY